MDNETGKGSNMGNKGMIVLLTENASEDLGDSSVALTNEPTTDLSKTSSKVYKREETPSDSHQAKVDNTPGKGFRMANQSQQGRKRGSPSKKRDIRKISQTEISGNIADGNSTQWNQVFNIRNATFEFSPQSKLHTPHRRQSSLSKPIRKIPFLRNPHFVGREDQIVKLEKLLFSEKQSKVAISGLGGVGKTQIAIEMAYRTKEKYPECTIIWIPAANFASLQQTYCDVARELGIPGSDEEEFDIMDLKNYLSQEDAGHWLLIFDNADDIDMWLDSPMSSSAKSYLPQSDKGSIIFTTRDRKVAVKLANPNVIDISEMGMEAAKQLLGEYLTEDNKYLLNNNEDVQQLLNELACLPLAIVQAASFINENSVSLSTYLSLLSQQEKDVIDLLSKEFEDDWRPSYSKNPVAVTWLISFEKIERTAPLAIEYLSFMACINPKNIPESLLPTEPSRKAIEHINAIGTLKSYSFVSKQSTDQSLDLHRLVHLATRGWLKKTNMLEKRIRSAIMRMAEVLPYEHTAHENRDVWRSYLPHARYLVDTNTNISQLAIETQAGIEFLWKYIGCLTSEGRWKEAELIQIRVLDARKRILGEEHPDTLATMYDLACIYSNQGWWKEAELMYIQVLDARRRILGEEHPDTFITMGSLAWIYSRQGLWKEAESMKIQVLDASRRKLGEEHPATLSAMEELAITYRNQGRWKETETMQIQVLNARTRILGEEHPDTLTTMHNLACIYSNQGRWKEAELMYIQVLDARRRILGEEHPDTFITMGELAVMYGTQGRLKEAETMQIQVLDVRRRILGEAHPDTLATIHKLAWIYRNQGRWKEAEPMQIQVLNARTRILGEEHPDTLATMHNLACIYGNQGRGKEAELMYIQVLDARRRILGEEHPDTLATMGELAIMYGIQGRLKDAETMQIQVLNVRRRILGEEHPDTLATMHDLAWFYGIQGRLKEAETMQIQVLDARRRILGEEHPDTLATMGELAWIYGNQGRWKEAEPMQIQVLDTRRRVLGEEHPETLAAMSGLAWIYGNQGRWEEAEPMQIQSLDATKRILGEEHPDTLIAMKNVEWIYSNHSGRCDRYKSKFSMRARGRIGVALFTKVSTSYNAFFAKYGRGSGTSASGVYFV